MSRIVQPCVLIVFAITLALSPLRGIMAVPFIASGAGSACADMDGVKMVSEFVSDADVDNLQSGDSHCSKSCCESGGDHSCDSCVHAVPGLLLLTPVPPDRNTTTFHSAFGSVYSTRSLSPPLRPPAEFSG